MSEWTPPTGIRLVKKDVVFELIHAAEFRIDGFAKNIQRFAQVLQEATLNDENESLFFLGGSSRNLGKTACQEDESRDTENN